VTAPTETGESSAAIYSRMDDDTWAKLLPMLQAGKKLVRPSRSRSYYIDGDGGLSATRVKKLQQEGVIRLVGVDTYALVEAIAP